MAFTTLQKSLLSAAAILYGILAIIATAYLHRSNVLSLPPSNAIYILTLLGTVIPFSGFAFTLCTSVIQRLKSPFFFNALLKLFYALSLLDSAIIAVTATLMDPQLMDCNLGETWQSNFRNKNDRPIRAIQDRLQCCGLHTLHDRAWPFPAKGRDADGCIVTYPDRNRPCFPQLLRESRLNLRTLVGIGVVSLLVKVVIAVVMRSRAAQASEGDTAWQPSFRADGIRRIDANAHDARDSAEESRDGYVDERTPLRGEP